MTKVKASFENQQVYVGLDVHKRSWNAAIYLNDLFIRNVHQPPSPQALHNYLTQTYPGAEYACAYESGKFGYWIQRQLQTLGIACIAVNPADIPSTHKDEVYKTDSRDSPGIGAALVKAQLKAIYIPTEEQ
jgi:transposase